MSRRLPDMSRRLVDLRFKVDDQGEALVRRTRRSLTAKRQRLPACQFPPGLFEPPAGPDARRQRLEQAGPTFWQGFSRGQEPGAGIWSIAGATWISSIPGHPGAGLRGGHPSAAGDR